jgi:signal transduction histidine kinase
MKRSSIRFRITALAAFSVAIVLVLASVGLVAVHRRQLTANVDSALAQRARDLTALVETADPAMVELGATAQEGFAQVLSSEGEVVALSPNLRGAPPLSVDYQAGAPEAIRTVSGLAVDDDVFRVLSRTIQLADGLGVLHVGTTLDDVAESTEVLTATLIVSIPAVVALLAGLVWWLVGRTLKPVENIRKEVAEIGATDLHRRVPLPDATDEIGRLAETMNTMLGRLESSMDRQQRFVGDASHELRSPLARMRAEIEVDLATAHKDADPARLQSLREEVVAIQRLVEDLLLLARLDADRTPVRVGPVDLDDLILKEARRLKADHRVAVDMSGVSGAQVTGDPNQLARAIRNLSDNAERHASHAVTFTLMESDGKAIFTVGDDGPGVPPEHADRIFERFVRVDDARGQATGGSGLGLAITREIIERHGGIVELDNGANRGARFVVTLPLA